MIQKTKKEITAKVVVSFFVLAFFVFSTYFFSFGDKPHETKVSADTLELATSTPVDITAGKDLLGKAEISFAGGTEERNNNIALGIARINGTTVLPGEEFSFTKVLGPVTEEEGYAEAKVFLNGEVIKGIGGGLCQVSTTLFRSLLSAGLPITERHNHSYTVSYYDVGLDATYSDPGPDLKFVNDTGNPLVIKGTTRDEKAVFEIYGTSDGRIASTTEPEVYAIVDVPPPLRVATTTRAKSEPECVNTPQIGYTAKVIYGVQYSSGELKQENFESTYRPLQKICYFMPTSTVVKI